MQSLALGSNGTHIHRANFFSFKIEEAYTLTTSVDEKVSQSILNRRMIVWSGWDSSICQNYSKKVSDLPVMKAPSTRFRIFFNPDSKIFPVTGPTATA